MNSESFAGADLPLGVIEPAVEQRPATSAGDPADDWLCAWCLHRVANEKDRFSYGGQTEFTFSNPDGVFFNLITFSRTRGCEQTGKPTLDHTWFAGHAWSFCQCERCGQHLGWYYSGPQEFAGLIADRIVRAAGVWN